jgi:hypothetical protein
MFLFNFYFLSLSTRVLAQRNSKKKKWRTTSFPLYDDIGHIVDGTVATGANAFQPGSVNHPPSPAADIDDWLDLDNENVGEDLNAGKCSLLLYFEDHIIITSIDSQDALPATQATTAVSQQVVPSTPAPPSHQLARKHSAIDVEDAATGYSVSSKCKKVSPNAQGMGQIASAVQNLSNGFSEANANASPARRTHAIKLVQSDGYLGVKEELKVFGIIRCDSSFADTLLAIDSVEKRERFVQYELKQQYPLTI